MSAAFERALALHRAGRLGEAAALYREILQEIPAHFDAAHLLGVIELQSGRYAEGLRWIEAALRIDPRSPAALANRGNALLRLNRLQEALTCFDQALAFMPDFVEAHVNRGLALQSLCRTQEALASFDRALILKPDHVEAFINRGVALLRARRPAEALADFDRVLALRPDFAEVHNNRGLALQSLRRFDQALASFERAIALRPDYFEAYSNRGTVLQDLNRTEQALANFDRALDLKPDYVEALVNRASALYHARRPAEAIVGYERALTLRPDHAEAHSNAAQCRLLLGDYARGWEEYEWRWRKADVAAQHAFVQPLWLGKEDIADKTVLLYAEQGLGDTLQFCRYAQQVAQRGARVVLEVQPALKSLLRRLAGVGTVVERGEALPSFDFRCPLMSLPLALGTTLETIPARVPYLQADPQVSRAWGERLGAWTAVRAGIVWSGKMTYKNDHNRSMRLEQLVSLLETGARVISLQKEVREVDLAALAHYPQIERLGEGLKDFADTAGLIENLDVVIAVDTAVAHLAGALGKPVWVLLPYAPDWRWLLGREDSPWYPTARLFRQAAPGDWAGVVSTVAAALRGWVR